MPDLITFAKGVNSGYVPVGGVDHLRRDRGDLRRARCSPAASPTAATRWRWPRSSPRIDAMDEEGIVENAAARRPRRTSAPASPHSPSGTPSSARCAARGVFWALELVADRETPEPVDAGRRWARLKAELLARGLLPFIADNRIHVVPPCIVTDRGGGRRALAIFDEVLAEVSGARAAA